MTISEASGYFASSLVFFTFWVKSPIRLRSIAICSNIAFLSYGLGKDLLPVAVLHAALLPVNAWRLKQLLEAMNRARAHTGLLATGVGTPVT